MKHLASVLWLGWTLWGQAGADAVFERARAAQLAGRSAEAEAGYRDYLKRFGPKAEALANLGVLLARRESYAEAVRVYEQALKLDPSLAPLHLNLGLAYLKSGNMTAALRELNVFLKAQPGHRQAVQLRAMALFELERYAESEAAYRSLGAGDASVALGLAAALLRQNKVAEAKGILEPVLARGDSPELQVTLGQAMLQEGRLDEAMAAFERARALNPNLPQLRLHVGSVHWRLRRTDLALAEWRAEYKERPQSFEAAYTLGSALALDVASAEEAESLLRKALGMKPKNARVNYQLARLIWTQRKSADAASLLAQATASGKDFREAFYLYGTVLQALGRKAEAAKAFARVREISEQDIARQQDLFTETK